MIRYSKSVVIFRRDLRLIDNSALNQALAVSAQVMPCFIFDPRQLISHPFQSRPGLLFMLGAIEDLQNQLQAIGASLALFHGDPAQVISRLVKEEQLEAVFLNKDYTPFSRARDQSLAQVCAQLAIDFYSISDVLLNEPEQLLKADNTPYKVFTAFYNKARLNPVPLPEPLGDGDFYSVDTGFEIAQLAINNHAPIPPVGRSGALAILENLADHSYYAAQRDFPALNATTRLSAHLKFGTCSVREVFYAIVEQLGGEHPLIRQLYWRDFFTHIAYHFPQVFGQPFIGRFAGMPWDNNPTHFAAWCEGRTGFPIIDAGMRELNNTGFIHNRVRMLTASFLVKDLHIDWRWGERYFARQLRDYDPCVNNGNWQWAASTGCDAQPYFRIFNPWLQQQKFDPDGAYIYQWLPELRDFPVRLIHQWDKRHVPGVYPPPIVDHALASRISKERFKLAANDFSPSIPLS